MSTSGVLEQLRERFGEGLITSHSQLGDKTAVFSRSVLLDVAQTLKTDLGFTMLVDLTAVDYLKRKPRFEIIYHFMSLAERDRIRIKVPAHGESPEVDSLCELWPNANWYEREVFDMFGIRFAGHPDLRRILLYPEFKGHPLRKDYRFNKRQPLIGPQD